MGVLPKKDRHKDSIEDIKDLVHSRDESAQKMVVSMERILESVGTNKESPGSRCCRACIEQTNLIDRLLKEKKRLKEDQYDSDYDDALSDVRKRLKVARETRESLESNGMSSVRTKLNDSSF